MNIKIYTIYHENRLYDEYNLFETDIIKPINIKNLISDKNDVLIKYNKQLSEFATMVYIWKNNVKSDYIGFQHYRRAFGDYDIKKLKEGNTLVKHKWQVYNFITNRDEPNLNYRLNLTDSYLYYTIRFKEFIYTNYDKYYYNRLNRILYNDNFDNFKCVYGREMYITNWNVFSKIVQCIYNFLEYIFGKNLENYEEFDLFQKNDQKLIFNNIDSNISLAKNVFKRDKRYIACYIENLISICIQLFSKNVNVCDKTSFSITLNYTGKENLLKWINKQYISGVSEIFINNINNKKIYLNNYRYQDVNIVNNENNNSYHYNIIINNDGCLSKLEILNLNNIFNKINKDNIKSINLNNNIKIINNTIEYMNDNKQQVNLITFLTSNYTNINSKLFSNKYDYLFDNIWHLNECDLDEYISNIIKNIIDKNDGNLRGYGYWIWKPYIIYKKLQELNDNDVLIFLDAHCDLDNYIEDNKFKIHLLDLINKKENHILCGSYCGSNDYEFTSNKCINTIENILNYKFSIHELKEDQYECGILIIKKDEISLKIIKTWLDIMLNNQDIITDKYNNDENNPIEFKEHRHDQSILSLICKYYKINIYYELAWSFFHGNKYMI